MTTIDKQGLEIINAVNSVIVKDVQSRELASSMLVRVKTKQKEVEAAMDPQCKSAYQAWQTTLTQKKKYMKPYIDAENLLKQSLSSYDIKQAKIREEEKLVAIEKARQEEQRLREKLLKRAAQATERGDDVMAESYTDAAENAFVPAILSDGVPEKSHGVSSTRDIEVRVVDTREFLKWLLSSTTIDPDKVVTMKLGTVKNYIKMTSTTSAPGLIIEEKMTISARSL